MAKDHCKKSADRLHWGNIGIASERSPLIVKSNDTTLTDPCLLAIESARLMADLHCENVVLIDVRRHSQVTQCIVVGSGTSDRQMYSVAEDVAELGSESGHPVFQSSRERSSNWMVIDFVDVIVHIFEPNTRAYYDLESLWVDAKRVRWRRAGQGM